MDELTDVVGAAGGDVGQPDRRRAQVFRNIRQNVLGSPMRSGPETMPASKLMPAGTTFAKKDETHRAVINIFAVPALGFIAAVEMGADVIAAAASFAKSRAGKDKRGSAWTDRTVRRGISIAPSMWPVASRSAS